MSTLGYFASGFQNLLTVENILLLLLGLIIGIMFGAIPGLNSVIAISLCLPLTFNMNVYSSFVLLIALYIGAVSGGLISAILINIPGTGNSVAATYDGYPMAMKGQARKALSTGIWYSCFGTIFGILVLVFAAPVLSDVALKFSPFNYFGVLLFAVSLISVLAGENMLKGLIVGFIGMLVATVGIAPIDGFPRFSFGITALEGGFPTLPTIVGSFVVAEIIKGSRAINNTINEVDYTKEKKAIIGFSFKEFVGQIKNFFLSAVIGTAIGILPGIGGNASNLLAYAAVKKTSKYPEKFGTGIMDGVVASETANNATIGGAMIPLLTLGIPGDGSTSVLLGALMIQGLTPGPTLFNNNPVLMYTIFAAMVLAAIGMVIVESLGIPLFVKMLKVPLYLLMPVIFMFCAIGAFSANNSVFAVWTLFIMGMLGYVLLRGGFPRAPFVLGFVLSLIFEEKFRACMQLGQNSVAAFFTDPICCICIIVTVLMLVGIAISHARKKKAQ